MKRFAWGELIVPLLMVGFAAAYWREAAGLSFPARLFPMILTGAMVLCLAVGLWSAYRARPRSEPDTTASLVTNLRRCAVILVPAIALWLLWEPLGGTLSVALAAPALAAILGERRIGVLLGLAAISAALVELLFIRVLYARIPDGVLGLII